MCEWVKERSGRAAAMNEKESGWMMGERDEVKEERKSEARREADRKKRGERGKKFQISSLNCKGLCRFFLPASSFVRFFPSNLFSPFLYSSTGAE